MGRDLKNKNEYTKVAGTTDIWFSPAAIRQALSQVFLDGCDGGGWGPQAH